MISKRSFPWPSLCTYTPYTYSRSFPANEVKNRGMADQERLFITLDTGFTYQSLLEEAEKLKIPKNTACSCLQRWQKQGIVRKGEKRGDYKKT